MNIYVNDEETTVEPGETLASFLSRTAAGGNLAVAVNDTVVRQAEWPEYRLQESDRLLLIVPVQGG
ncbi:MAG: sulfur carrier protein ThiS [Sedimenticola sp.]|nr:sulfur carrier protein ThiS [Sedimenticola sp.]